MIILVIGGSKSGKSSLAEKISYDLHKEGNLYYLATMNPYDLEDLKRIDNHVRNREKYKFITIEKKKDLEGILSLNLKDTMILDSLTSLVTNEMFLGEKFNLEVTNKVIKEIEFLKDSLKNLVIVSDYVLNDSIKYDDCTESFRRELGKINTSLAEISDVVLEVSYNNIIFHKGRGKIDV